MLPDNPRPLVEVNNIYAGQSASSFVIEGLSMEIASGEIVTIIGQNGTGKSSILKVLFGLIPVTNGRILFNDRDITHIEPRQSLKLGIAYVPQSRSLFPDMSVYENLELGLFWQSNPQEVRQSIAQILAYFSSLRDKQKQLARFLSGAEQRLLEIARAILWQPRLLLIDEPSLNLAPVMRDTVFETLVRLNAEIGLTVLMAEQNTHLGVSIAQRVYLLHLGRIIYEGKREELMGNHKLMRTILGD